MTAEEEREARLVALAGALAAEGDAEGSHDLRNLLSLAQAQRYVIRHLEAELAELKWCGSGSQGHDVPVHP